jgi:hypothetical protein
MIEAAGVIFLPRPCTGGDPGSPSYILAVGALHPREDWSFRLAYLDSFAF